MQHGVAYVGSNDPRALWHELGTSAAAAKHDEIGELIGKKFHALLVKGWTMIQTSQNAPMVMIVSGIASSILIMVIVTRQ